MAGLWRCHGDGLWHVPKFNQLKVCTGTKEGYWNIPVNVNWSRWNCLCMWLLHILSKCYSQSWHSCNSEWTACACLSVSLSVCTHVSLRRHAHVSHSLSKNYACVQYNSPTVHLILIWDLTLTFPHYIYLPFSLAQVIGSHEIPRLLK